MPEGREKNYSQTQKSKAMNLTLSLTTEQYDALMEALKFRGEDDRLLKTGLAKQEALSDYAIAILTARRLLDLPSLYRPAETVDPWPAALDPRVELTPEHVEIDSGAYIENGDIYQRPDGTIRKCDYSLFGLTPEELGAPVYRKKASE